jgi:pyrimidine-specific ribonucleoside hydrolase
MVRPLILDCDPGIDDMIAILVAAASPEFELLGVTTVGGNAGIAATTRNARQVLDLAGRAEVPVAAGAARSLVRRFERFGADVHGADGLGGLTLPPVSGPPDPRPAVTFQAERLEAAGAPVTLVATGPLTNIALLYALHPELVSSTVEHLVVMGGSIGVGNVTPAAEFNIRFDPEAAYRVLSEPMVPTTLVGLDVTMRTALTREDGEAIRGTGRVGAAAGEALDFHRSWYERLLGEAINPVHDAVAVVGATRPELLTRKPARVTVDTGYGPGRGNTLVDFHEPDELVTVATEGDREAIVHHIKSRLASLDA